MVYEADPGRLRQDSEGFEDCATAVERIGADIRNILGDLGFIGNDAAAESFLHSFRPLAKNVSTGDPAAVAKALRDVHARVRAGAAWYEAAEAASTVRG